MNTIYDLTDDINHANAVIRRIFELIEDLTYRLDCAKGNKKIVIKLVGQIDLLITFGKQQAVKIDKDTVRLWQLTHTKGAPNLN